MQPAGTAKSSFGGSGFQSAYSSLSKTEDHARAPAPCGGPMASTYVGTAPSHAECDGLEVPFRAVRVDRPQRGARGCRCRFVAVAGGAGGAQQQERVPQAAALLYVLPSAF